MIFGYLPQAIVTIRTRDTDGIALPTFCMLGLGSIFSWSRASLHPTGRWRDQHHHYHMLGDSVRHQNPLNDYFKKRKK